MQAREAIQTDSFAEVDLADMAQRIAVQPPYFALTALYRSPSPPWEIYGTFQPEQPLGAEPGPIATAEAGRHLAILGSCAAALAHRERVYYLAAQATWRRSIDAADGVQAGALMARARIAERTRNSATAQTELLCGDQVMGSLTVRYHALPEASFAWLYARHAVQESLHTVPSPYTQPLPLAFHQPSPGHMTGELRHAGREHSAGHFPGYPMWPVAIVVYGFGQTVTHLLETTLAHPVRYRVERADIEAFELMPLGAPLSFHVTLDDWLPPRCELQCVVSSGGTRVAQLASSLLLQRAP
jgi:hypothetical protein